jgi:6-phosphofructokinase 2
MLQDLLAAEEVPFEAVPIAGHTRENFVVGERESGQQYRFVLPGPELDAAEQQRCLDRIAALVPSPAYLVMSGSLSPGVAPDIVARIADLCREAGIRLVLDMAGEAPARAAGRGVFLLKPNRRELETLIGRVIDDEDDEISAARELIDRKLAEAIIVSLSERGALMVTADAAERFSAPGVPVVSAVGAGDSMVAGMICGLVRGLSLRDAVRLGMAAGAAALMTPGTELARREDIEKLARLSANPR